MYQIEFHAQVLQTAGVSGLVSDIGWSRTTVLAILFFSLLIVGGLSVPHALGEQMRTFRALRSAQEQEFTSRENLQETMFEQYELRRAQLQELSEQMRGG